MARRDFTFVSRGYIILTKQSRNAIVDSGESADMCKNALTPISPRDRSHYHPDDYPELADRVRTASVADARTVCRFRS